mmetsp:Transcript_60454/g.124345  ORF Transcript_60454/g.124345 Transcript_60454/m.124345 type:complete len:273 (+) Transcript_60454:1781-2599(+)
MFQGKVGCSSFAPGLTGSNTSVTWSKGCVRASCAGCLVVSVPCTSIWTGSRTSSAGVLMVRSSLVARAGGQHQQERRWYMRWARTCRGSFRRGRSWCVCGTGASTRCKPRMPGYCRAGRGTDPHATTSAPGTARFSTAWARAQSRSAPPPRWHARGIGDWWSRRSRRCVGWGMRGSRWTRRLESRGLVGAVAERARWSNLPPWWWLICPRKWCGRSCVAKGSCGSKWRSGQLPTRQSMTGDVTVRSVTSAFSAVTGWSSVMLTPTRTARGCT